MGLFDFLQHKKEPKVNISFTAHEPTPEEIRMQRYDAVQEIRKLRDASFPSKNGLRPHEILMLSYAPSYNAGENNFAQFWYFKYGVENPGELLTSLYKRGFIRIASAKESVENLRVSELKEILASEGIPAIGKKADLVASVQASVSEKVLADRISKRRYILTERGQAELKENEYVMYLHGYRYSNVSVWKINQLMQGCPPQLWRDKIWGELNQLAYKESRCIASGNYGPYINIRYQMADFVAEDHKYKHATALIAEALYHQIIHNCVKNYRLQIELRQEGIKSEPLESFAEYVSKASNYGFTKLENAFSMMNLSGSERGNILSECYNDMGISDFRLSKYEFITLLLSHLDGNDGMFITLCNKLQKECSR